ncbi:Signal transduction histidine kinase [Paramicrobacterium humi]|uniref:histidine kinase n=1 Tax=Paramicrobacterium humi TaxID=640635 RepID=A0A1H4QEF2_9MICO|nr:histidine kinase [Microbacterium humi]SEC17973.1 Signal transduction histidine kinase [Microbacterium humi]
MIRNLTPRQHAVDGVLGTLLVVLCLPFTANGAWIQPWILAGMGSIIVLRRVSPALALTMAWVFSLVQMGFGLPPNLYNVAILAVVYTTARYGERWVRWYGLGSAIAGGIVASAYMVFVMLAGPPVSVADITILTFSTVAGSVAGIVVLGLSWTLGQLMRTAAAARIAGYERYQAQLQQRRAESATIVEQERNRIARDMHDVVAHSLAVVIAQADGARYVHKGDADALGGTLETVSETARQALGDVRLLLSELRHEQDSGPQPTLGDVPDLVSRMRSAGLTVAYTEIGTARPVPAGRQIAVYRILQEALTNALHHGDRSAPVDVVLRWSDPSVELVVENAVPEQVEGPPAVGVSRGHGLPGMRERATLAGGTLAIDAPRPGRFRIHATVPVAG